MAVQRAWDFNEGWFANPTFINGDYPSTLKAFVSDFLPPFSEEEKSLINGTADIFAHDAYTSQFYFGMSPSPFPSLPSLILAFVPLTFYFPNKFLRLS